MKSNLLHLNTQVVRYTQYMESNLLHLNTQVATRNKLERSVNRHRPRLVEEAAVLYNETYQIQ